jgi:osmotically-inducible protein OsmY
MNDKTLRQNIIDELNWTPAVDAAHVGVAVNNGVATLSGHVPTYSQLVAAEAAVRRVKGVTAIAQEMEVWFFGDVTHNDEDIASRAVTLLKWTSPLSDKPIDIKVAKGWITLTGEVEWHFQRQSAGDNVRDLIGVKGVVNLITVKPRVTAGDVVRGIEDALKRDARYEADRIKVSVENGKVRLDGLVHSWHERAAAEHAAWASPGVRAVDDHVLIG